MTAGALDPNATAVPIPPQYLAMFQEAAQRNGLPLNVLAVVVKAESGFDPNAIGDNGTSYGFGQIHLPAHPDVTAVQAADPQFNVNWIAQSLGNAYKRYNGNVVATILYNNCPVCADHFASTGTYGPTQALSQASQRYLGLVLQPVGGLVGVGTTGTEWMAPSAGSSPTNPAMPLQPATTTSSDPVVAGFQAMLRGDPITGTTATSTDVVPGSNLASAIGVDSTGGGQTTGSSSSSASTASTDAPAPTDTTTITTPHPVQIVPTGGNKAE